MTGLLQTKSQRLLARKVLARQESPDTQSAVPRLTFFARMGERRVRALIVDDHSDAAESLARLLHLMGCSATFVTDPAKAIDAAEVMKPEIVFLDLGMPGIDGYEVARMFRSRYGDAVRLVAVTAYGEFSDRMKSKDAGIDEHIAKPLAAKTLQTVLATVLSRR